MPIRKRLFTKHIKCCLNSISLSNNFLDHKISFNFVLPLRYLKGVWNCEYLSITSLYFLYNTPDISLQLSQKHKYTFIHLISTIFRAFSCTFFLCNSTDIWRKCGVLLSSFRFSADYLIILPSFFFIKNPFSMLKVLFLDKKNTQWQ